MILLLFAYRSIECNAMFCSHDHVGGAHGELVKSCMCFATFTNACIEILMPVTLTALLILCAYLHLYLTYLPQMATFLHFHYNWSVFSPTSCFVWELYPDKVCKGCWEPGQKMYHTDKQLSHPDRIVNSKPYNRAKSSNINVNVE